MNLIGKKVILRAVEESDIELLRNTINDPQIESTVIGWSLPVSKKNQLEWFDNYKNTYNNIRYIIVEKDSGKTIGTIGLFNIDWKNGTVGGSGIRIFYMQDRNKGLAYDSLMTLLKYVFYELRLNRIDYTALSNNNASIGLVKKVGYKMEGIKRCALYKNGKFNNVVIGGCLKSDYEEKLQETHYWDEDFSEPSNPPQ